MSARGGWAIALAVCAMAATACGSSTEDERAGRAEIGQSALAGPGAAAANDETPAPLDGAPEPDDDDEVGVGGDGSDCAGGDLRPSEEAIEPLRRATLCLINAERRSRGLSQLRSNRVLARAALAHARDMVLRSYFAHDSLSGANLIDRIRRVRYASGRTRWLVGENLAWGEGVRGTPREIVAAWMNSPPHRANILRASFRDVGLGIVPGAPRPSDLPAATYNTNFGAKAF